MKNKFENSIKEKLEDFIETNEIPYQPEHWEQLKRKKNAKKRVVFYWRWAAVLLLFLLAGGMANLFYTSNEMEFSSNVNDVTQKDTLSNQKEENQLFEKEEEKEMMASNIEKPTIQVNEKRLAKKRYSQSITRKNRFSKSIVEKVEKDVENKEIAEVKTDEHSLKTDDGQKKLDISEDKKEIVSTPIKENKKVDFQEIVKPKKEIDDEKEYRNLTIGFDASSMLSYNADKVRNQLGYSGGVSVEIPLFNKFDIQAGVLYSNQKIDNFTHPDRLFYSEALLANRAAKSYNNLTPRVDLSSEEITVNMIEIPLSLKYNFHLQEQKLFVSAGISASSVLNQKINSKYDVGEKVVTNSFDKSDPTTESVPIKVYEYRTSNQEITTQKKLYHFYPLSAFQFSFGGEFNVGKTQSIVIEPYYKQFIQPITTKKTTFTNVGIRLQYRFNLRF